MKQWPVIEDLKVKVIEIKFKNYRVCKHSCKEPIVISHQYQRNVLMSQLTENGPITWSNERLQLHLDKDWVLPFFSTDENVQMFQRCFNMHTDSTLRWYLSFTNNSVPFIINTGRGFYLLHQSS